MARAVCVPWAVCVCVSDNVCGFGSVCVSGNVCGSDTIQYVFGQRVSLGRIRTFSDVEELLQ